MVPHCAYFLLTGFRCRDNTRFINLFCGSLETIEDSPSVMNENNFYDLHVINSIIVMRTHQSQQDGRA